MGSCCSDDKDKNQHEAEQISKGSPVVDHHESKGEYQVQTNFNTFTNKVNQQQKNKAGFMAEGYKLTANNEVDDL